MYVVGVDIPWLSPLVVLIIVSLSFTISAYHFRNLKGISTLSKFRVLWCFTMGGTGREGRTDGRRDGREGGRKEGTDGGRRKDGTDGGRRKRKDGSGRGKRRRIVEGEGKEERANLFASRNVLSSFFLLLGSKD